MTSPTPAQATPTQTTPTQTTPASTKTPHVRVTPTKLADGRELFYFDDSKPYVSGAATRRLDDPRPLPDRAEPFPDPNSGAIQHPTGPEMRFDPLTGE
ncbi:MAG: galactose-1-phosphate uridylyltransferase, partial [Bifidobacteriaceae bacterium]|nr:galactose-1-phosphate uridylyltransferase [Bifidobacteriaceae bacterium]